MQEKLLNVIPSSETIVWNTARMLDAAQALEIPAAGFEQVPEKLGPTDSKLKQFLPSFQVKACFSCAGTPEMLPSWRDEGRNRVAIAGIETHVCVQQTALDLLALGYQVMLVADATGSRFQPDYEFALRRMESQGVTITTTEAMMFEWCRTAEAPAFRTISQLAKQSPPA